MTLIYGSTTSRTVLLILQIGDSLFSQIDLLGGLDPVLDQSVIAYNVYYVKLNKTTEQASKRVNGNTGLHAIRFD